MDKIQLSNLAYSMRREILCVGDNGCYASTTVVGCHTRKYHGLYVCPQPGIGGDRFVLLAQLQETVSQQGKDFHIGVSQYGEDIFEPKGHKYLEKFELGPHPIWWYRVGGILLKKEMLMHKTQNRLFLKYTLEEAHSETTLSLKPFCSFRNMHGLTQKNEAACKQVQILPNGIKIRMYPQFSDLYIQSQKELGFEYAPDWYLGIEYMQEKERGYDYKEDWFTPGSINCILKRGEPLYVAIGSEEMKEKPSMVCSFAEAEKQKLPATSLENCLKNAADDFLIHLLGRTQIIAGFPWFGSWGRDTFISLPGITLSTGKTKEAEAILDSMLQDRQGALFPNVGWGEDAAYNSVDAPLWFIWAVQQYRDTQSKGKEIWAKFGSAIRDIIDAYASGRHAGIYRKEENGMIYASIPGRALTWMDAVINGQPVTPRAGAPVEINALWYNAVCFALELAQGSKLKEDKDFVEVWKPRMEVFPEQFKRAYWDKTRGYLADVLTQEGPDWSLRPNQILAAALTYKPLSDKIRQVVVEKVSQVLLTPRGLRTLSPKDSRYEGIYEGDQSQRDSLYHQGVVWVWQLEHFAKAYYDIYGSQSLPFLKKIWDGFEDALGELCEGSISEIYDGNPPHRARGTISQAWSVAALLRIKDLLKL